MNNLQIFLMKPSFTRVGQCYPLRGSPSPPSIASAEDGCSLSAFDLWFVRSNLETLSRAQQRLSVDLDAASMLIGLFDQLKTEFPLLPADRSNDNPISLFELCIRHPTDRPSDSIRKRFSLRSLSPARKHHSHFSRFG
jgi:hypothetical protein